MVVGCWLGFWFQDMRPRGPALQTRCRCGGGSGVGAGWSEGGVAPCIRAKSRLAPPKWDSLHAHCGLRPEPLTARASLCWWCARTRIKRSARGTPGGPASSTGRRERLWHPLPLERQVAGWRAFVLPTLEYPPVAGHSLSCLRRCTYCEAASAQKNPAGSVLYYPSWRCLRWYQTGCSRQLGLCCYEQGLNMSAPPVHPSTPSSHASSCP